MLDSEIFIHIGYGRTGTTWLQNRLFPNFQEVAYLGKTDAEFPHWLLNWNYLDRLFLPQEVSLIQEKIFEPRQAKKILISSEAFTQTGGIVDQVERIKLVVRNPKIILILRDPTELVISKYRRLKMVGYFKHEIEKYLDFSPRPFDLVRRARLYLYDYHYPAVIDFLQSQFGVSNVLVLKYELLSLQPNQFISALTKFIDTEIPNDIDFSPVNQSLSEIPVSNSVTQKLREFFTSLYNYSDII